MEQFWQFVGGYWWLVFPLAGVLGGAVRGVDRALDRHHKRRLEVMSAKAQLRAARTAPTVTAAP